MKIVKFCCNLGLSNHPMIVVLHHIIYYHLVDHLTLEVGGDVVDMVKA